MRWATIRTADGTRAVRIEGEEAIELDAADVVALLEGGASAAATGRTYAAAALDWAPLVPRPSKIVCLGLNYRGHIEEMGRQLPEYPTLFAKFADALIGARDPISLPGAVTQPDWEAELGIVIGRTVRHASEDEGRAAIAGYTIVNDVSMRDWQNRSLQWLQGKTWEGTTPVGPVLVTPDEIDDAADLAVRCEVDGVTMQSARTSELIFGPAAIVSYVSTIVTLRPGDLISTGTPDGVGAGRTPPVFLRTGQVVRTSIEGIGELVNPCVAEAC